MLLYLFLLFTLVPLIEIMILIEIGRAISLWPTVGLILLTGFVGAALARHQGVRTLLTIRSDMAAGKMPTGSLVDGLLIFVAGTLLITPGILTDCVGFSLLIPFVRQRIRKKLAGYFEAHTVIINPGAPTSQTDEFVDVEAEEVHRKPPEPPSFSNHLE